MLVVRFPPASRKAVSRSGKVRARFRTGGPSERPRRRLPSRPNWEATRTPISRERQVPAGAAAPRRIGGGRFRPVLRAKVGLCSMAVFRLLICFCAAGCASAEHGSTVAATAGGRVVGVEAPFSSARFLEGRSGRGPQISRRFTHTLRVPRNDLLWLLKISRKCFWPFSREK